MKDTLLLLAIITIAGNLLVIGLIVISRMYYDHKVEEMLDWIHEVPNRIWRKITYPNDGKGD